MRGGMLRTFVDRALRGETIEVDRGGAWGADLVYVNDVAHAIAEAVTRRAVGTFNAGSGARVTSADAARAVLRATGRAESDLHIRGEAIEGEGFAALDIRRAREALDFAPRSLDEGLQAWITSDRRSRDSSLRSRRPAG
jgi:nucleoside-diphosphate-sugar epimerase